MTEEVDVRGFKWWVAPAVVAAVAALGGILFLVFPGTNYLVRSAGSVLGSEDPFGVRIFLVTAGGRSPVSAVLLLVWQSILAPLPEVPALRAIGLMWGPLAGAMLNWIGLFLGSLAAFGVARGLVGGPFARFKPTLTKPLGISRWVMLGLRVIPFVPSDFIWLGAGASRVAFKDFLFAAAIGSVPPAIMYAVFPDSLTSTAIRVLVIGGSAIGVGLLGYLAWNYRSHIPVGELSDERKRNMLAGAVAVAAGLAAYYFIPSVRIGVDEAVKRIAAGDVGAVREYILSFGVWAPVVSALLMVLQSIIAPLPAFVITFSNGALFGWAWGALLSWSSAMAGAAICFYIARSLGRPAVEKLVGGSSALGVSDRFFERFGERTVLIARLLPFVSFDLMSYGAGLTSMRFWPFFVATGIGQLPATLVYSYLGQNMAGSIRILFITFVITIAIFVAIATARPFFMRWLQRNDEQDGDPAIETDMEEAGC
ncbi:MAG: VTT domain-containing protein [Coriobacteriia bacterium]|nr:VTT domain-containing protein [Coriobacteriia bacterium]